MLTTHIQARIEQILADEFGVDVDGIVFDAAYDNVDLDSLLVLELALSLQTELDVELSDEEIGDTVSLDSLVDLIRSKLELVT